MKTKLRRALASDAEALSVVGTATFLESYAGVIDGAGLVRHCAEKQSAAAYAEALCTDDHALWLIESEPGGAPVGYLHLTPPDLPIETRPGDLEIKRIYVLATLQRYGLGRELLNASAQYAREQKARRLLLGVYKKNEKALSFYDRVGFERVGERAFDVGGVTYSDWVLAKRL
jgi:ribosomal protein S18 acetylase RimI-like enzyme